MATTLTNPAAAVSFDYGGTLDKVLGAYQAVSVARYQRDAIKYGAAPVNQQAALYSPEAVTPGLAYATGNVAHQGQFVVPGAGAVGGQASGKLLGMPSGLVYGGLALGAGLLLWKVIK